MKRRTIRLQALLVLIAVALAVALLAADSYALYRTAAGIATENARTIEEGGLRQVRSRVDLAIGEMRRLVAKIVRDPVLAGLLRRYDAERNDLYLRGKNELAVQRYLSDLQDVYPTIRSANIAAPDKTFRMQERWIGLDHARIADSALSSALLRAPGETLLLEPGYAVEDAGYVADRFVFLAPLRYDGKEDYVLLGMDEGWMDGLLGTDAPVAVGDPARGAVVWSRDATGAQVLGALSGIADDGSPTLDLAVGGVVYRIQRYAANQGLWTLVEYREARTLPAAAARIGRLVLLSTLLAVLIGLATSALVARRMLRPVHHLLDGVRRYVPGRPPPPLEDLGGGGTLRMRLAAYFAIVALLPLLLNDALLYSTLSDEIRRSTAATLEASVVQTTDSIAALLRVDERLSKGLVLEDALHEALIVQMEKGTAELDESLRDRLDSAFAENLLLGEGMFSAALFDREGRYLHGTTPGAFGDLPEIVRAGLADAHGEAHWFLTEKDRFGRPVLMLARKVLDDGKLRNGQYRFETVGYLVLAFRESDVRQIYKDLLLEYDRVYLSGLNGTVFSSRQEADVGTVVAVPAALRTGTDEAAQVETEGGAALSILRRPAGEEWVLGMEVPWSALDADRDRMLIAALLMLLGSLVPLLLLAAWLSSGFTRPLDRLTRLLGRISDGEPGVAVGTLSRISEIERLGDAFNRMSLEIRDLIETVYASQLREQRLENERRQSELVALKAQIDPHFLYNTLESIIWLVRGGEKEKAAEMIAALGEFFRRGLRKDREFVPLREELDLERNYLRIQALRFGDRLRSSLEAEPDAAEAEVPLGILQPLLENAIRHGIAPRPEGGTVTVRARLDGQDLVVSVEDDGPGIPPDRMAALSLALEGGLAGDSIGIFNVQKRLRIQYGDAYGIKLGNAEGGGTRVSLRVPARRTPA